MLAKLLLWVCFESRYTLEGRYNIGNVGKTASMSTRIISLNQDIHWREGTTLVMLAKLLLWVCLLSLNQDIHWREGTTLVMLAKLLLWVCLLSLNQDIHWREGTTLAMLTKLLLWACLLSLNQYIHWREGTTLAMVYKTASMSMLTLFESRYTLKGMYNIMLAKLLLWVPVYIRWISHSIGKHDFCICRQICIQIWLI